MKAIAALLILLLSSICTPINATGESNCKATLVVSIAPSERMGLDGFFVYIDGNLAGKTELDGTLRINLAPGQYSIVAKKQDDRVCFSGSQDVRIRSCNQVTITLPVAPCRQGGGSDEPY
jgi:hypothetical protein